MDTDALMDAAVVIRKAADILRAGGWLAAADREDSTADLLELTALTHLPVTS